MAEVPRIASVIELQRQGILLVEDGNHGEYRPRPNEFVEQGIAFIRAADMADGEVLFEAASKINDVARRRITKGVGAPGDVLLSHKGTVGKVALVPDPAPPFVCSPQTTFWRTLDQSKLDRRYLFAFIRSAEFHRQLATRSGETDMAPYVSLTSQRSLLVSLPPIETQRSIAHVLGTLDDKIELNRRMNGTLEAMARALFKSWFIDFDPVRAKSEGRDSNVAESVAGLFPESFEDSGQGEIPSGWRLGTVGSIVDLLRDKEDPSSTPDTLFHHYSIPAFDEGQNPKIELGGMIKSQKSRVLPGTILFSKLNPEISRVWLVDVAQSERAICSTEFMVLRPRIPFGRSHAYCLARSPEMRQQLMSLVTGTSKSHQRAHPDTISRLPAVLPPENIAMAFEAFVSPLLERTLSCRRESVNLVALRDTLLPKLISGEIRVKDAEKVAEAIT